MSLQQTYGHGQCASLALAVLEHLQLPCVVFYRDGDPDDDSAVHVANLAVVEGGEGGATYLDIYGLVTQDELEARYGCALKGVIDPAGEDTRVQFEVCMGEWSETADDPFGAQRAWRDCGELMKSHLQAQLSGATAARQRMKP